MTCASCCNPITGGIYYEPIGKNDGIVAICSDCATVPVEYLDNRRGWDVTDDTLPSVQEVAAGMERRSTGRRRK